MKGSLRIYIETYGCSANQAESEIMAGLLEDAGFRLVDGMEDSDLVLINTCFVKTPTEQKILDRIRGIVKQHPDKKMIIAGCMPEARHRTLESIAPGVSMVSTHNVTRIADAVRRAAEGGRVLFVGKTDEKKLGCPRTRRNRLIGITEISQGCDGDCAYCCVRLAKGRLRCYPPADIANDVENALKQGCMEIWLTSQDNAAYSCDGTKLPALVKRICGLSGDFRVRVGMMDPDNVTRIIDGLLDVYSDDHVYKFLHLPVQSGSDRVLKTMKRRYKASDFSRIVSRFRESIPSITISTDVIVGFPGEAPEDFRNTVELIKATKPDIVNVSKFGARPGTQAAKMQQLDNRTVKGRSAEMSGLVRRLALERNMGWRGWKGDILVTERGRHDMQYVGRNFAYKPVLVESGHDLLGRTVKVEIKGAEVTHLQGVVR